jgi:hypothetical protein
VLFQANGGVDSAHSLLNLSQVQPFTWETAGKIVSIFVAGGFGGWIYGIVSLLEGGKENGAWKASRGCSALVYILGQAIIGVGGAFAAIFGILTLGNAAHSSTSDLTDVPLYFVALCVVGGFIGNRLLVGVGEKMAKQLTDVDKKAGKALDTAREAENKAENAEAIANQAKDMLVNAWIARDLCDKIDLLRAANKPIPEELRTEAEGERLKLDAYRSAFPTTRILFIVLGNLTFGLDHADDALARLEEFIANRKKAGSSADELDVAAAWYNITCYFALLSATDPKSRGYSKQDKIDVLQKNALDALEECLKITKKAGKQSMDQRLAKAKKDPDLKPLEGLDRFNKLLDRYEKQN